MKTTIIISSVWLAIHVLAFLLRKNKHLDFGIKQGWHLHWIIGFGIPVIVLITGAITGWFTVPQIKAYGLGSVIVAAFLKDVVYDKWMKKGTFSWMDIILTISAGFTSIFFFVTPILNS